MPERAGEAWNDEDMETARRMYTEGRSNSEIAIAVERTKAAVVNRLCILKRRRRLGLDRPDER